eukprot:CAMPEP_0202962976 /NCGR_PEP_ID=MMETSP1396-20130829/6985_1 /ASSEMBLY_ACC=CAM_ASM_000872 /TAXON_ID= /ORGANISM="Pseudokeronopsis sp., Strain Brazil" /LENGTH=65 /DNA_ID=CAMNT_0049683843 /DNA_START=1359 /DNA_END=1556 /DNA_ORIENTATION=+
MQWAKSKNKPAMCDLFVKYGEQPIETKGKNNKKMPPPPKQKINEKRVPKPYLLTVLKEGHYQPMT